MPYGSAFPHQDILKYIIHRFYRIDGISLTVADVDAQTFKYPSPYKREYNYPQKPGDEVNLECDLIGKYVGEMEENPEPQTWIWIFSENTVCIISKNMKRGE